MPAAISIGLEIYRDAVDKNEAGTVRCYRAHMGWNERIMWCDRTSINRHQFALDGNEILQRNHDNAASAVWIVLTVYLFGHCQLLFVSKRGVVTVTPEGSTTILTAPIVIVRVDDP